MDEIVAGLGPDSLLAAATLGPPPEWELDDGETAGATELFLAMSSPLTDDELQKRRAGWQSQVTLAALWDRLPETGDSIWGGRLAFTGKGANPDDLKFGEYAYRFRDNSGATLLKFEKGFRLSPVDKAALEKTINSKADALGLRIERLIIAGNLGTTVDLEVSGNAHELMAQSGDLAALLNLLRTHDQEPKLEGTFLAVRDSSGAPVMSLSSVHALLAGSCGVMPEYQQYFNCYH